MSADILPTQVLRSSKPLVVIHPSYRNRYALLPNLIIQNTFVPIYATVQTPNATWQVLWQLLAQATSEQIGLGLRTLPDGAPPEVAAQQLCEALGAHSAYLIVLDAADRLQQDSCRPFLAMLVQQLPRHSKIILIGRAWLADLLKQVSAEAVACLPVLEPSMLFDYSALPADVRLLEVYAHAGGRVLVNGAEVNNWEGQLPRILFHFFVDHGIATRDEIFQTFWSELPLREATNVFHVTKRKVHQILGFDLTVYQNGYYCLAPEIELRYDTTRFLELIQQSDAAEPEQAIPLLESAVRLYRNDFLRGLNGGWIEARRAALRNQLAEAFGALARLYEGAERDVQAIGAYERGLAIQPYREDWARNLMSLYAKHKQAKRGVVVFERLERALQKQMGKVKLDKRTQELAAKLRRML